MWSWVILILVAAMVFCVLKPRADFVIRAGPKGVRLHGKFSRNSQPDIVEFFQRDLALTGRVKVLGTRSKDGRLHLQFRGRVSVLDRQRIRNFLTATLDS